MTSIEWREVARGEWRATIAGFTITIVLQPESPEEAWAWAVAGAAGPDAPIAAGYELSLEAARGSAECAVRAAVR